MKCFSCMLFLVAFSVPYVVVGEVTDFKDAIIAKNGNVLVTRSEVDGMIGSMKPSDRQRVLASKDQFHEVVVNVLARKKMAKDAIKIGLDRSKEVAWRLESAKNEILVNELIVYQSRMIKTPDVELEMLAKEYYDSHPEGFNEEEQVNIAHILFSISVNDGDDGGEENKEKQLELAKKARKEIEQGFDFAEAAKKYSDDASNASSGGELGYFSKGKMVPTFDKAAFALKDIGDVSDIVETPYGYHLIKLIGRKPAGRKSYFEVKKGLVAAEKKKYIDRDMTEFIESYESAADITIFVPAIEELLSNRKSGALENKDR